MHFKFLILPLLTLGLASPAPAPSGGLLSDLPDIVDNVKDLLSQDTIDDLQTIVKGGAVLLGGDTPQNLRNLLSKDNIDKLQDVINNAHTLITTSFVNDTSELVGDAAPVSLVIDWHMGLAHANRGLIVGCRCVEVTRRNTSVCLRIKHIHMGYVLGH